MSLLREIITGSSKSIKAAGEGRYIVSLSGGKAMDSIFLRTGVGYFNDDIMSPKILDGGRKFFKEAIYKGQNVVTKTLDVNVKDVSGSEDDIALVGEKMATSLKTALLNQVFNKSVLKNSAKLNISEDIGAGATFFAGDIEFSKVDVVIDSQQSTDTSGWVDVTVILNPDKTSLSAVVNRLSSQNTDPVTLAHLERLKSVTVYAELFYNMSIYRRGRGVIEAGIEPKDLSISTSILTKC